jgi:hypothetical protein
MMEGLFEMLMEQHSNEPSLSSVVLDWLRYVQKQPELWEKLSWKLTQKILLLQVISLQECFGLLSLMRPSFQSTF